MRCEDCQTLAEEYFDGELSEQTAAALAGHVEGCLACARTLQQLQREQHAYQDYEPGVELSPASWAQVQQRIVVESPRLIRANAGSSAGWQAWFTALFTWPRVSAPVAVALVLAAIVSTVLVMKYLNGPEQQVEIVSTPKGADQPAVPVPVTEDAKAPRVMASGNVQPQNERPARRVRHSAVVAVEQPDSRTPSQLVREAEQKYLSAIAMLTRDVGQRDSQIDAATRSRLEGALAAIDHTIAATRRAVKQNPNDPVAVRYMLSAYGKKVDVLREMTSY
jgi:anti-sigma-K factor RskA